MLTIARNDAAPYYLLAHHHFCFLPSSCFSASPAYDCLYLMIKLDKGLVPLALLVLTKDTLPKHKHCLTRIKKN